MVRDTVMRKLLNQEKVILFALFIDRIYAKVRAVFIALGVIFLIVASYLYVKLPHIIPIHWNASAQIDTWGIKETIFVIPIAYLFCLALSSKKFIQSREIFPAKILISELVFLTILSLLAIIICIVYTIYFSLV